jgi:DNA-directed RNA polymerase specialized sigma24 family protein
MRRSDRVREDEFRAYVVQRRGSLLRTATLLEVGDAHEAEDLVQTVLLRIFHRAHTTGEGDVVR